MKEFKSFTARAVIDYLDGRAAVHLVDKLENAKLQHKTKSEYQVWREGSHPKEILSEKMLLQKIDKKVLDNNVDFPVSNRGTIPGSDSHLLMYIR